MVATPHLVVLAPVIGHLAAPGEKNEIVSTVPLLDGVEAFLDFTARRMAVKVAGQENRFNGATEFGEALVGRMLDVVSGEPA